MHPPSLLHRWPITEQHILDPLTSPALTDHMDQTSIAFWSLLLLHISFYPTLYLLLALTIPQCYAFLQDFEVRGFALLVHQCSPFLLGIASKCMLPNILAIHINHTRTPLYITCWILFNHIEAICFVDHPQLSFASSVLFCGLLLPLIPPPLSSILHCIAISLQLWWAHDQIVIHIPT